MQYAYHFQIPNLSKFTKMGSISSTKQPHAVCIPFPAQGHITPMLKLAKLLHYKGFHITFVNTEFNHKRLLKSRGDNSLDGVSSFRFLTIPDGLPPVDVDATQDAASLCVSTESFCLDPFKQVLRKLGEDNDVPPVSCVVSDGGMSFTADAAEEFGIPQVYLWTASACGFIAIIHFKKLVENGIIPLKDESYLTNGYLDTTIDWIPGMEGIQLKDLPSFVRTTNPDDVLIEFCINIIERVKKGSAIILNTFDPLEQQVLQAFSSLNLPPVYSIGPLHLLLNQISPENETKRLGSNLWKEDSECITWLDTKEPNSVVYVNFGSITVMTNDQLIEFAWGLANSKHEFLWVLRPDLVEGNSPILPTEFVEETRGRGFMAKWCPQEDVLSHPAVGGFLTHSGWNSTLESICAGVPMICWPFFADQQPNCWFCVKLGIGMEIDNDVKRDQVEMLVTKLMVGEKGMEMKKKVMEFKNLAWEATLGPVGSSFVSLENFIEKLVWERENNN